MDARAPALSNWPTRNLKPARALDDIELVQFHSDATFKSARGAWSRNLSRMGDPAYANMIVVCWTISGYMGFARGAVAFPDQNHVAADLGWSLSTIRRALELAEAWGWLSKIRRPLQTNVYRMSFSRSVCDTIELEHDNRIAEFRIEAAKKKLGRDALRSLRSERKETSDLSEPFAQNWMNGSLRSERLSSSSSTEPDPHQPSSERLGDVMGPVVGLVDDVGRLASKQLRSTYEGEPASLGSEIARFVKSNTPGSNLWFARLALDRLIWDQIQMQIDPDWRQSFRRMEKKARDDFGQEMWWRPGQTAPQRAPMLGAVAGGSR